MLRLNHKVIISLCLAAIVGIFAGNAAAETIYDFDSNVGAALSAGGLNGQDNWANVRVDNDSLNMVSSGATGWTGNYVAASSGNSSSGRLNDLNWSISAVNNQDFEFSAILLGNDGTNTFAGISPDATTGTQTAMFVSVYNDKLYWRVDVPGDDLINYTTASLTLPTMSDNIYRLGFEATALGDGDYSFRMYYENLTSTGPKTYINNGAAIEEHVDDISNWGGIFVRIQPGGGHVGRVDEIRFSQIPEPSTLALLATGLIGLLCYAWRKRK